MTYYQEHSLNAKIPFIAAGKPANTLISSIISFISSDVNPIFNPALM
jgi:hypothetical protein